MNLFQHPDDIQRFNEEPARRDRRTQLLRALRGAVPLFSDESERKLTASMRQAARGGILVGERR